MDPKTYQQQLTLYQQQWLAQNYRTHMSTLSHEGLRSDSFYAPINNQIPTIQPPPSYSTLSQVRFIKISLIFFLKKLKYNFKKIIYFSL